MTLLLLGALGFFHICKWFMPLGHVIGFLGCGLGLLGLRRGLSKSFGEVPSFLNTCLGFLKRGLDIVPRLLDKRMGNHKSFKLKRIVAYW
jgi:hypothetical protein